MEHATDIIMPKNRQFGCGLADHIIGFSQGFEPNKIIRRGRKRVKTNIGDVPIITFVLNLYMIQLEIVIFYYL